MIKKILILIPILAIIRIIVHFVSYSDQDCVDPAETPTIIVK